MIAVLVIFDGATSSEYAYRTFDSVQFSEWLFGRSIWLNDLCLTVMVSGRFVISDLRILLVLEVSRCLPMSIVDIYRISEQIDVLILG